MAQRGESQLTSHGSFMKFGNILKMKEYMAEFILEQQKCIFKVNDINYGFKMNL